MIVYRSQKGSKLTSDEVDGNFQYLENEVNQVANPNRIITLGTESKVDNTYTYQNYVWSLNNVEYTNSTPNVLTIAPATTGFKRKDISVFTNNGTIEIVQGIETDGTTVTTPEVPAGTLYFKFYDIDGATVVDDPTDPIIGEQFIKKSFSQPLYYAYTGSNVVIPLPPTGNEKFYFVNDLLTSLSGFNLSLITGNPTAEIPYNGKEIIVFNATANPITINHNAVADIPFIIKDASNLIVPPGELVRFMYEGGEMKELFRSWSASENTTLLQSMWQFSKFHQAGTNNYPFLGAAISGGNVTAWYNGSFTSRRSHNIYTNGFLSLGTGGDGSNRGYKFAETVQSQASLYKGFTFFGMIAPYIVTDITTRIGVLHSNTFTANTLNLGYTCHFEILNDKLQFITSSNSIATYGSQITIDPLEWLMLFIEVEENDATTKAVRFKVKKVDGTIIYNEVSTTNIPYNNEFLPLVYSQMQVGIITTKGTSAGNEYIANLGYMGYGNEKPNFLKDF